MRDPSLRATLAVYAGLTAVTLGLGAFAFTYRKHQITHQIEHTFETRRALLAKFVALHRDQVSVMRNQIEDRYAHPTAGPTQDRVFREHPALGVWEFETDPTRVPGRITGDLGGPLAPDTLREIQASLAMGGQIRSATEEGSDVAWAYYLSARRFIYLAPPAPVAQVHFSEASYRQRSWLEAVPQANPTRRMILAGPSQDLGGKGWVLTFAEPVYAGEAFLGIAALDVRVDTLQALARLGQATGESMLISENDRLIARERGFTPDQTLRPPVSEKLIDWREDPSGDLWLSSPIVKDELWLMHRVGRRELAWAAARESSGAWILLPMLFAIGALAWHLKGALAVVTRITQVDPLTQALNRRGLFDKLPALAALAERKYLVPSVLIMDIDFFKKVNDTHGHAVGDEVLQQVGAFLRQACRPFDLVCRWGGEEFVVVLLLNTADEALASAERVRQEAQRTRIQPGDLPITLSGGLVLMRAGETLEEAIRRADALLYQAKAGGRNRIVPDLAPQEATSEPPAR